MPTWEGGYSRSAFRCRGVVNAAIVGSNLQDRWFFLYGFEKKDRETIDIRELAALQTIAAALLAMEPRLLEKAVAERELEEICHEEKSPAR